MRISIPCIALLLTASLSAQNTETLPSGLGTTESAGYGYYLGGYENGRFQIGMSPGLTKAAVLSKIDFRRDGSVYTSGAVARTWSSVSVALAETDAKNMSTTFSANIKTTPQTVFMAAVSWPAANTAPTSKPMAWGSAWACTFSKVFLYTGKQDMLTDFTFQKGTLSNGGTWGTSLRTYYLDGLTARTSVGGSAGIYGLKACNASTHTGSFPTYSAAFHWSYAKTTGNPTTADKMAIRFRISYSVPNTAHIQVATLAGKTGNTPGTGGALPIDLGWCNMLQLNLGGLNVYNYPTTNSSGSWSSPTAYAPYPLFSFLVGSTIYTQAAYDDKKATTYKTKLTAASKSSINAQPADANWKGRLVYRNNPTSPTGSSSTFGIPVQRVTYK